MRKHILTKSKRAKPADGVTIAKEIEPKDAYENMGVRLVREVAAKGSISIADFMDKPIL